jgi:hypothetical protein
MTNKTRLDYKYCLGGRDNSYKDYQSVSILAGNLQNLARIVLTYLHTQHNH